MNIVVITDGIELSKGGGVGTCIYDLCDAFLKNNKVYLIGIAGSSVEDGLRIDLERKGVNCIDLGAHSRKEALIKFGKYQKKLRAIVKDISYDEKTIVNLHLKLGVLYGVLSTMNLRNIVRVETYHNTYHHYQLQCWTLAPFIKHYVCVSSTAKEEMHKRFFIPYKKLTAIPNGVNREKLREQVNVEKDDYQGSKTALRILSVGRLSEEKNLLTSIKAFSAVKNPAFRYIVVGDGPQMEDAQKIATEHSQIILRGQLPRNEVMREIAAADVICMPSLWEGRSIFMLEAAAFDKPFILSDVPGLREPFNVQPLCDEHYRKCEFGFLVETNNRNAYIDVANEIIKDIGMLDAMRNSVRKMSVENDMKKVSEQYLELFKNIVN